MEEERQIPDHNGELTTAITPVEITDIDEMSTSVVSVLVETDECDCNISEKRENVEGIDACPEDETQCKTSIQETEEDINAEGSEMGINPPSVSHAYNDQDESQTNNPLPIEEPLTQQSEEETLVICEEEEITSFESDKENGEESFSDDQENGPKQSLLANPELTGEKLVVGNRHDICKHSYSRYDTVSYRKIRKGNTKQRIDEFESMMNL